MAKSTKNKPFEEKIAEFKGIIEELDDSSVPLDELIKKFEQGIKLASELQEYLNSAEQKITELKQNYFDDKGDNEQ